MASKITRRRIALLALVPLTLTAQSADRFVGTIESIKAESLEIVVKPDSGEPRTVKLIPQSVFQRVAPGEKDLKQAVTISATDLATGDRVLVTLAPSTTDVRRMIVMSATDISKRNEAERQDWLKRGVGGVVTAKKGNEVTVKMRSIGGETEATVAVSDSTKFRRYAPDSVRFVDAKPSSLAEVSIGDQLRARGEKNEAGTRVTATEVVFGTFVTKAGKVTAVNPDAKEVTVIDSATNKPLTIKLTADSQLKKMFSFGGPGGAGPGGFRGGAPGEGGRPGGFPGANANTDAAGQRPGGPGAPGGAPQGPSAAQAGSAGGRPPGMRAPDMSQMLERMPAAKLEDIQPGEMVVVSSTKGATNDQVTAIMMVTNAERLIQMASMQRGSGPQSAGQRGGGGLDVGGGAMGLMGGMEGMQLPGMVP